MTEATEARFSANGERELSTLDLALPDRDTSGGVLVRLTLHHSELRFTARTGKPFILRLGASLALTVRLDLSGLHALAVKAARSKSGKAKAGPLTVRGGGHRALWVREDLE